MMEILFDISFFLFIVSVVGYVLAVFREKSFLMKNMVFIDKKSVTQNLIDDMDIKEFLLGGVKLKSGDEIKVALVDKTVSLKGILIGAKKADNTIFMVTYNDKVKKLHTTQIKKIKVVSRYGKFFTE